MNDIKLNYDEFENVIISQILKDESYLNAVSNKIKSSYFSNEKYCRLFEVVNEFFLKRGCIPTKDEIKTICLPADVNFVSSLDINNIIVNKDELYDNTLKYIKYKGLYESLLDMSKAGLDKIEPIEAYQKLELVINCNLKQDNGLLLLDETDRVAQGLRDQKSVISTGWKNIDKKIKGGYFEKGRALYVYAGQPNIGKSIFLGNAAINIAKQNKSVLLISMEMSEMVYAERLSAGITQIPIYELPTRIEELVDGLKDFKASRNKSSILIKEFPPSTITPSQIESFIKDINKQGMFFDAIIIDYINIVAAPYGDNSYERGKVVAEKLRALSYIFECPIISAVQFNRSGMNTESSPDLESIAESAGIAATADVIWSLWQTEENKDLNIIAMTEIKNRHGPKNGTTHFKVKFDTLYLREISEDEMLNMTDDSASTLDDLVGL